MKIETFISEIKIVVPVMSDSEYQKIRNQVAQAMEVYWEKEFARMLADFPRTTETTLRAPDPVRHHGIINTEAVS